MVKDAGAETLVTITLAVLNISVDMSQAFQMFNVPFDWKMPCRKGSNNSRCWNQYVWFCLNIHNRPLAKRANVDFSCQTRHDYFTVLATTSARTLSIVFRSIKNAHTAAADTITVTLSYAVLGSLGSGAQATRHANRLMSRFEIIDFFSPAIYRYR
jgi:hypothetical protein